MVLDRKRVDLPMKLKHWSGIPAIFALEAAPVLEFHSQLAR